MGAVTNNAGDFLKLAEHAEVHPGLVFLELGSAQAEGGWLVVAIDHIEHRAAQEGETTEEFMLNRVVEVDRTGNCTDFSWPAPRS